MAYTKTTWTDRVLDGSGNPIVTGTSLSASNLNKIETGIEDAHAGNIVFPVGSASLPSVTFTGDTDTGVYRPASNTIGVVTGAVEVLRITSNQRFVYGNTVHTNTRLATVTVAPNFQLLGTTDNHGAVFGKYSADANSTRVYFTKSRKATMGSSATTGHTIVQNGDVLGLLTFAGSDGTDGDATTPKYVEAARIQVEVDGTPGISDMPGKLIFGTTPDGSATPSERMRIDSAGYTFLNTTSQIGGGTKTSFLNVSGGSSTSADMSSISSLRATTSTAAHINFANGTSPGTVVGTISTSSSTTSYGTTSDYRLKENVKPMVGALDKVKKLNPVTYTWVRDQTAGQGFIAHELQEVIPDAVTGKKDNVTEDGNPIYQNVDASFLVATLVKAIQELNEKIEKLEGSR